MQCWLITPIFFSCQHVALWFFRPFVPFCEDGSIHATRNIPSWEWQHTYHGEYPLCHITHSWVPVHECRSETGLCSAYGRKHETKSRKENSWADFTEVQFLHYMQYLEKVKKSMESCMNGRDEMQRYITKEIPSAEQTMNEIHAQLDLTVCKAMVRSHKNSSMIYSLHFQVTHKNLTKLAL